MARIRSIKPEVRISEKVNSWPIPVRYFWVLLWGYCDDYGYGRDNPRLIVADSFPLDDSVTADMVSGWMDRIWADGVIERFAVDDARYFRVVNWDEHQKISHPAKKVLPDIADATEVFQRSSESLRSVTEAFEKVSPKQGAGSSERGTEEAHPKAGVPFSEFWDSWPRKVARADAEKAWAKAIRKVDPSVIVGAARALSESPYRPAKQFIPYPATWLNKEQWADPPPEAPEDQRRLPNAPQPPRSLEPGKHTHKWLSDGSCMLCTARKDREDTW